MKRIDVRKIEEIRKRHFDYCMGLAPQNNQKLKDENICWRLCCENPFDFTNTNPKNLRHKYLRQEYWEFVDSDINYEKYYASFRTPEKAPLRNKKWNGIELLKSLKVDVCPYYGLNYISPISKRGNKVRAVATLDHYLPKSQYKFLALNLYNLIPSCKNCNSTFKRSDARPVVHPFFEALEDNITFYLKSKSIIEELFNQESKPEIGILYDINNQLLHNHNDVLSLETRYNYFSNLVKSLIIKRHRYNYSYLTKL